MAGTLDGLKFARYIAVTAKVLNFRVPLSGISSESKEYLEECVKDGYIEFERVPIKKLVNYFSRNLESWANSPFCKIISKEIAEIDIKGPKGIAAIIVEQTTFEPDSKKEKEIIEKYSKEKGFENFHEGVKKIMKALDQMEDSEEAWEKLYELLDEGIKPSELN